MSRPLNIHFVVDCLLRSATRAGNCIFKPNRKKKRAEEHWDDRDSSLSICSGVYLFIYLSVYCVCVCAIPREVSVSRKGSKTAKLENCVSQQKSGIIDGAKWSWRASDYVVGVEIYKNDFKKERKWTKKNQKWLRLVKQKRLWTTKKTATKKSPIDWHQVSTIWFYLFHDVCVCLWPGLGRKGGKLDCQFAFIFPKRKTKRNGIIFTIAASVVFRATEHA